MELLKSALQAIPPRSRVAVVLGVLAAGLALFAFVRWENERRFKTLYSSLAPEDAAAIVQKLKEAGADYRVSDNGTTVEVASDRTAELRLQMAAAGLPKTGRIGFELFDKTSFGTTDFTEHVNFRRALEGELERSVMSLAEIEHARVHLTFPKDSVFLEARQPAKASVLVRLRPGTVLLPGSVMAVTHLIASAVEGLSPDAVSVLDMRGNLLNRPRRAQAGNDGEVPEASLEFQQHLERNLLAKINSTLEPLLGPDRFRAAVSVDCDFTSGEQSEEVFDPAKSVMVSSQRTEDSSQSGGAAAGIPGTASSLPRAEAGATRLANGLSRRTESIAYQSSRTVRRTRLPQGAVRRVSASVLVDHDLRWEGEGSKAKRILQPPAPEQLKVIRDVVSGAIAFNAERGDQLIVESVPFDGTLKAEPPSSPKPTGVAPRTTIRVYLDKVESNPWLALGIAAAIVLLVAVATGWLLSRRRNRLGAAIQGSPQLAAGAAGPSALPAPGAATPAEIHSRSESPSAVAHFGRRIESATHALREGSGKDAELYAGALADWVQGQKG